MNYKFDGSKVFFTSDTHFYHGNIIRFCNRPFKDVEMMNETCLMLTVFPIEKLKFSPNKTFVSSRRNFCFP